MVLDHDGYLPSFAVLIGGQDRGYYGGEEDVFPARHNADVRPRLHRL